MNPIKQTFLYALAIVASAQSLTAQTQKGSDIDGEATGDYSGISVSMPDANTIAIGANGNDTGGTNAGHVRVYEWNDTSWVQKGLDIDGEAADDNSGYSVSMPDANTIAIGAYLNDGNGSDAGHVRVYSWTGSVWVQKGLDIDGEAAGDNSGSSVSMPDSNTIAIGATLNAGTGADAGHVRVYSWTGSAWVQKGLDIDGEAAGDYSGTSVSMPDANTLAIGAIGNTGSNGAFSGHARVYRWSGSAWVQKGLDIDGKAAFDYSGISVSMPDSNTVAIGADYNSDGSTEAGHVRIFNWNGSAWEQKGLDIYGEAAYDYSGASISMPNANTIAIGAMFNDDGGNDAGHVRVYRWEDTTWVQTKLDIDGEADDDQSGSSVSMPDANTLAIGAHRNDGNGLDAGHARVYSLCSNTNSTISPMACDSYTSPSSNYTWTTSGIYMDTIPNLAGCDSVITVNLTIDTVDVTITNLSPTLTANAAGAIYQWLDCNNAFAVISGQTSKNFTPATNGNYAVEVTQNGCTDTSACESVTNVGIIENGFGDGLIVSPNPTNGQLTISLGSPYAKTTVIVRNMLGQVTQRKNIASADRFDFLLNGKAGIYFIEIDSGNKKARLQVIKEE